VVFACALLHSVLRVASGNRHALRSAFIENLRAGNLVVHGEEELAERLTAFGLHACALRRNGNETKEHRAAMSGHVFRAAASGFR
jgi:hypothetical protein